MEAQLEKESRMVQLQNVSHNYSHDSAIDTDMQEWDSETLTIELVMLCFFFSKNYHFLFIFSSCSGRLYNTFAYICAVIQGWSRN